jgi:hypothetical protein
MTIKFLGDGILILLMTNSPIGGDKSIQDVAGFSHYEKKQQHPIISY